MYVGECILSIVNMIDGIQKYAHGYQNYNTIQYLIFGEYVKVRKSLYAQVVVWIITFYIVWCCDGLT